MFPPFPQLLLRTGKALISMAITPPLLFVCDSREFVMPQKNGEKREKNPSVLVTNCGIIVDLVDRIEELRPLVSLECRLRLLVKKSLSNNTTLLAEYWKQQGKVRDCVLGDGNTKYFQMCATIWLGKNQIRVLDPGDTLVFSHSGKEKSYMTSTTTF